MCSTSLMTSGGDGGHLLVEREGHVMVVTMNRPERRNALSPEMMRGMGRAWDEANSDPDVRAVILTGAGGAFCAGADLQAMSDSAPGDAFAAAGNGTSDGDTLSAAGGGDTGNGTGNGTGTGNPTGYDGATDGASTDSTSDDVASAGGGGNDITVDDVAAGVIKPLLKGFLLDKPLIAAVEGPAIAGGTEILQATDIRIAGESARFGVPEVCRGIYPLGGSVVRLRRQIPYTVAADLLLTGRHISAAEAQRIGLIGEIVPDGTALDRAREVAATVAANGPVAVRAVLAALRATEGVPERDAMRIDAAIGMAVFASDDAREGPRAFVEKRTPRFTGH
jgi:enoyl-CoA hydratase